MAWRKPNVSSDVWPDHFGPNRNPPHGAPVGTTVSVVRLKDPGLKSERIKKTMSEKNYPQKDEPQLVFLSRPAPGQKYEDWVDSLVDELFKPGGLADGKIVQPRNPQFPGGN